MCNTYKGLVLILSTIDIICNLLEKQNKKQKDLTDYLGISKNAFTDWKSGRINSYHKHLPQIAAFFDVSVDYLLGKFEEKELLNALSKDEQHLLNLYRDMSHQGQEYLLTTAEMAAVKYKKDNISAYEKKIVN